MSVVQLTRRLDARPQPIAVPGIRLRNYEGRADIPLWLELRRRAFARQKLGVGNWEVRDFEREFLEKPWWQPHAMWFAVAEPGDVVVLMSNGDFGGVYDDVLVALTPVSR